MDTKKNYTKRIQRSIKYDHVVKHRTFIVVTVVDMSQPNFV